MTLSSSQPNAPVIAIVPVGAVPNEILQSLLPVVGERVPGRDIRLGSGLPQPDAAFSPERNQYLAAPILAQLGALRTGAERLLGVADLDLYVPGLNFIFGQAKVDGAVAVMALARLRPAFWGAPPDLPLLVERAVKEAIHELGHTYGLQHCPIPTCVMHFSNTLAETDRFCPRHETQLRWALGGA